METIQAGLEEVEGLDQLDESGWGDYPIDTLLIRTESRTVFDVVRRIDSGGVVLNPEFQRDFIWPIDVQSKLIESVMMRIPLPVFYLAEDEQGRTIVVDGLQRLSTFHHFLHGGLRLQLPHQELLHKKKFSDLTPKLQNRVEDCNLVLYIIDAKVPERARLDIFERVNSGIPLTRQQMRNCLYSGPATAFLKQHAKSDAFQIATGGSLKSGTMRDREFVNRFCAFKLLDINDYRGDMDEFLARALRRMNTMSQDALAQLGQSLQTALVNNWELFGKHSFRKHSPASGDRTVINASLWDVMSTGLAGVGQNIVVQQIEVIRERFYELMRDPVFIDAITYSPNSTNKVHARFHLASGLFEGLEN
ncbi:MAG: DUF262 domain-containing protein [Verrucomicrobiaceae bacterium]|nr:MAG: DUF262 domain-containing protein [Verrucomicrobiaceae bacterium]